MVKGGTELSKVLEDFDVMFKFEFKSLSRMITAFKCKGLITASYSTKEATGSSL
jgi:hypothetical protein